MLQGSFSGARSSTVVRANLSQFTPRETNPVVVGAESEQEEDSPRERKEDEVTLEDPIQEESDAKSESHVIFAFQTCGHSTKPLLFGKEGESDQWQGMEEWRWARSEEEVEKHPVWTTGGGPTQPGECCDDQTVETSGEMEDETCARSDMTNGQSLQPSVDHRPRWRKRWQKHTELQGKEVDRILKQRTLEPDEDPVKMSRHLWKTP